MQGAEAIKDSDFNVKFVANGKYKMDQLITVYNHMIDELRTERTKQEQQHLFLTKLIYTSPTGILILDYDENIQEINPKALKLLNVLPNEVLKKPISSFSHPVLSQVTLLQSGESKTITFNGATKYKLQKSHFIDRGFARHFVMIEELTQEILAAEKKAYGKLIRMMAHEVNNTIGLVNSILQSTLATENLWKEEETGALQKALEIAVDRNYNLNSFMRNFADVVRLPEPDKKTIDLHKLIRSVSGLMERKAVEKQVEFAYHISETPLYISAEEQQMEQALINLVKNAIEAIEEKRMVSFTTDSNSKQLLITDSGKGIPGSSDGQLFSPFFSTKKDGQGIGLTLVKEILVNHEFEFSLKTEQPGMTAFMIRFQ